MFERSMFLSLNFYKKEPFHGSLKGFRYQLVMKKNEEEGNKLNVIIWPEPYCLEATDDSRKREKDFSFDEEGLQAAIDWMNEMYDQIVEMVIDPLL